MNNTDQYPAEYKIPKKSTDFLVNKWLGPIKSSVHGDVYDILSGYFSGINPIHMHHLNHLQGIGPLVHSVCTILGNSGYKITPQLMYDLEKAAFIHDIGQPYLSNNHENPPELHPTEGAKIITKILDLPGLTGDLTQKLEFALPVVLSHHEKFDGSGYPNALEGDQIPIPALMVSIADQLSNLLSQKGSNISAICKKIHKTMEAHYGKEIANLLQANLVNILTLPGMIEAEQIAQKHSRIRY